MILIMPWCIAQISVPGIKVDASGAMSGPMSGLNLNAVLVDLMLGKWCSRGGGECMGTAAGPASSASSSAWFSGFASSSGTKRRPYLRGERVVHCILGALESWLRMSLVSGIFTLYTSAKFSEVLVRTVSPVKDARSANSRRTLVTYKLISQSFWSTVHAISLALFRTPSGIGLSNIPYDSAIAGTPAMLADMAAPTVPLLRAKALEVFLP